jgi:hypothetical protein
MVRRVLLILGCASAVSCGAARIVEITPTGGVVALQGDRDLAMPGARQAMDAQCGEGNYAIVRQWEQPVGTYATASSNVKLTPMGAGTYSGKATTDVSSGQVTEWRMEFQCGARRGPPGAAPLPPIPTAPEQAPAPPPPPTNGGRS